MSRRQTTVLCKALVAVGWKANATHSRLETPGLPGRLGYGSVAGALSEAFLPCLLERPSLGLWSATWLSNKPKSTQSGDSYCAQT